ncbi:GntR family transcriptional regulator [Arthrobacter sp. HY1533]|uniref:GntR family transcriptional regulator n=1 Tax=Arthrobacter sp. HY1533 TaxID=2970919 RepID=UPI0022B9F099|nr:GntR family transcriptional regulator [Arthrobacter sp. HY1533]
MEAQIVIDLTTATPPYEQVQTQITSLIAVGSLPPGTRLPTVRSLAADLGVAAGTVARAYKELEAAGLVTTNRRQGTVVAGSRQAREPTGLQETSEVMAAVEHLLDAGERAGLDGRMLISLLQGRLNQRGSQ